jgi:ABC-type uncharacterized transport system substrate-binding protein
VGPAEDPFLEIAILFDSAVPDHGLVAAELTGLLSSGPYRLAVAAADSDDGRRILDALRGREDAYVVAIGLDAARLARDELDAPVVFAQVFNHQELLVEGRSIRGVSALPPFGPQAREWRRFDPDLRRVGLIVSERHAYLVSEAGEAVRAAGVAVEHAISSSDQETLYLFKRLVPQIDGLWLIPDDRILSPAVLGEMLDYAVSHGVRVAAFSDALLGWGALFSATSTVEDVARTIRTVLESVIADDLEAAPAITPLSEVEIRVNKQVADRLGLGPWPSPWIVRTTP